MEKGLVNYTSEYITEEPDAVVPHVRICVGAVQVTGRSTMTRDRAISSVKRRFVMEEERIRERSQRLSPAHSVKITFAGTGDTVWGGGDLRSINCLSIFFVNKGKNNEKNIKGLLNFYDSCCHW